MCGAGDFVLLGAGDFVLLGVGNFVLLRAGDLFCSVLVISKNYKSICKSRTTISPTQNIISQDT